MILNGIQFPNAFSASGSRNFHGHGYPKDRFLPWLLADMRGSVFIAKTATLFERVGNMPLEEDGMTPKELFPSCIRVKLGSEAILNAVGLSGPGASFLFQNAGWEKRKRPFFLSFMAMKDAGLTLAEQYQQFQLMLRQFLPVFGTKVGLQINFSCPNVGMNQAGAQEEIEAALDVFQPLDIPIIPKFNPLVDPELVAAISRHPACSAVSIANTIPWKELPDDFQLALFDSTESPLHHLGGGGLSGKPVLPFALDWLDRAKGLGIQKPILGGPGAYSWEAAKQLLDAGASGVEFGSICILRPWEVQKLIRYVNRRGGVPEEVQNAAE